ncbi:hypothetical protein M408DRAFT_255534 [Serendipita vermifera MAFF 305830]|uniref:Vacuolar sorting protein Vps3844 C-terminal domain-containing protein n=1 Tax=Serendipita vermifera MAFF 305830 TaxID=933852 RepID=A0A0C3BI91_SERVB|nr:hypothetical protein M408DRAFT_255534 [Serendipita vermifera MAFF 305830]
MKSLPLFWPVTSFLLPVLCNAAATVFLRPSGVHLGELSAAEADVLIANHLGLESTVSLGNEDFEHLLEKVGGQAALGKQLLDSADDSLLFVMDASFEDLQEFLPDSWGSPSFTSTIDASSLKSMIDAYNTTAGESGFSVYSNPYGAAGYRTFVDMFGPGDDPLSVFLKTSSNLAEFIDQTDSSTRRFGAFHITTLIDFEQVHDLDSVQYSNIKQAINEALTDPALERFNVAVVFSAPETNADRTHHASIASMPKSTQAPFPAPPRSAPIFSNSICYASASTCQNGTTECSGRGQCVPIRKGPRECYVCQCAVTKDTKNRTEYWSGASCQNKDVSMAFSLVAGTTVAIVLIIVFSISLLYSIGTQELPNVLTGGIVHAKHD